MSTDGKFHMLPTGELVVLNTVNADSYSSYQCRVTHRLTGETRASTGAARITVAETRTVTPPQFSERSISIEVRRDELVVLPCIARGHPPPDYRYCVWSWNASSNGANSVMNASPGITDLFRWWNSVWSKRVYLCCYNCRKRRAVFYSHSSCFPKGKDSWVMTCLILSSLLCLLVKTQYLGKIDYWRSKQEHRCSNSDTCSCWEHLTFCLSLNYHKRVNDLSNPRK